MPCVNAHLEKGLKRSCGYTCKWKYDFFDGHTETGRQDWFYYSTADAGIHAFTVIYFFHVLEIQADYLISIISPVRVKHNRFYNDPQFIFLLEVFLCIMSILYDHVMSGYLASREITLITILLPWFPRTPKWEMQLCIRQIVLFQGLIITTFKREKKDRLLATTISSVKVLPPMHRGYKLVAQLLSHTQDKLLGTAKLVNWFKQGSTDKWTDKQTDRGWTYYLPATGSIKISVGNCSILWRRCPI